MRKEDPRRRNISFGLHAENFGRGGYQVGKEKKKNFRSLAAERLAAAMFIFFLSLRLARIIPSLI